MKVITLLATLLAGASFSHLYAKPTPVSAYADASLVLTSSNESELATATATSGAGFADAIAQPGLLQNSILTAVPGGAALSFNNESVSGFTDTLIINLPGLTGSTGSLLFHFLVSGLQFFGGTTAPAISSITTAADFTATATGTPGASDNLTFTQDAAGNTSGTDFLGVPEMVSVPFIFGEPLTISLDIDVTADADDISGGGGATVSGTYTTTASTDSVMALVQGAPVAASGYTAHSASGMDYFSVSPVPEPDGLYLAMAGLAALPLMRLRRR